MSTIKPGSMSADSMLGQELDDSEFQLVTRKTELFSSKVYLFRCADHAELKRWTKEISKIVMDCNYARQDHRLLPRIHRAIQLVYEAPFFQYLIAAIIILNFSVNVWEAEVTTLENQWMQQLFKNLDLFFTISFSIELLLNLFANGIRQFLLSAWNWMDAIIVGLAYVGMAFEVDPTSSKRWLLC